MWTCNWKYSVVFLSTSWWHLEAVHFCHEADKTVFQISWLTSQASLRSIFSYTEGQKRQFQTGVKWGRALVCGKGQTCFLWKGDIYLRCSVSQESLLWGRCSISLPWQPTLQRIRSLPGLIAAFRFISLEGDGVSCCKVSRAAGRKCAQQRAHPSSFGRKASERTSHVCTGLRSGSPRQWQVLQAGALAVY